MQNADPVWSLVDAHRAEFEAFAEHGESKRFFFEKKKQKTFVTSQRNLLEVK